MPAPTANAVQLAWPSRIACAICTRSRSGPTLSIEKPNSFGQLADQHGERDAVHVAVADRLGQQLGDESQAHHADQDAHQPGHHRHHARQRPRRASGRRADSGSTTARITAASEESGPSTRMRLGSEQRVGEQRDDRGVQAVDSRDARSHRVGDADRHQHRGQHQAGHRDRAAARRLRSGCSICSPGSQRCQRSMAHPSMPRDPRWPSAR